MSRDNFTYVHGDTGVKPAASLDFQQGGKPKANYFDWWWTSVINAINGHANEFDRLDEDDDGKVDAADKADSALTWKQNSTEILQYAEILKVTDNLSLSGSSGTVELSVPNTEIRSTVDGSDINILGTADQTETNAENYTDSTVANEIATHKADTDAHHDRYSDSEAVNAVSYRINPVSYLKEYYGDNDFGYQTVETYNPTNPRAISEIKISGNVLNGGGSFEKKLTPVDWGDKRASSVEFKVQKHGDSQYLNKAGVLIHFDDNSEFSWDDFLDSQQTPDDFKASLDLLSHYIT